MSPDRLLIPRRARHRSPAAARRRVLSERLEGRTFLHGGYPLAAFGDTGHVIVNVPDVSGGQTGGVEFFASRRQQFSVDAPNGAVITVAQTRDSTAGSKTVAVVSRYLANGTLDPSFGTNGQSIVHPTRPDGSAPEFTPVTIQRLSDGRLLVLGESPSGNYTTVVAATLSANGAIDPAASSIALPTDWAGILSSTRPGGDDAPIYLVGAVVTRDAGLQRSIMRLNADGTPDTSFGVNGEIVPGGQTMMNVIVTNTGDLVVPMTDGSLHAYAQDGSPIVGFGTNGVLRIAGASVSQAVADANGGFYAILKWVDPIEWSYASIRLAHVDAAGNVAVLTPTATFVNAHFGPDVVDLTRDAQGRFYVGMQLTQRQPGTPYYSGSAVMRLNADGTPDASFGVGGLWTDAATAFGGPVQANSVLENTRLTSDGRLMLVANYPITVNGLAVQREEIIELEADSIVEPITDAPVAIDEGSQFRLTVSTPLPPGVTIAHVEYDADASTGVFTADQADTLFLFPAGSGSSATPAVRLTLSDGNVITASARVAVRNLPPVITSTAPERVLRGESTAIFGFADAADSNLSVTFASGASTATTTTQPRTGSISFAYPAGGTYTAHLSVSDDASTVTSDQTINVYDLAVSVREDVNHNSIRDGLDVTVPGVRVVVDLDKDGVIDAGEPEVTTTAATRALLGQGLPTGAAQLIVVPPDSYSVLGGSLVPANILGTGLNAAINVLLTRWTQVAVQAFVDADGNGVRTGSGENLQRAYIDLDGDRHYDADEPIAGILAPNGSEYLAQLNVPAGTYAVRALPSVANAGPDAARPSASVAINGTAGQRVTATLALPPHLGGANVVAYLDANGDGVYQPSEALLSNVVIHQDDETPGTLQADREAFTLTNGKLSELVAGTPTALHVIVPPGYTATSPTTVTVTPAVSTASQPLAAFGLVPIASIPADQTKPTVTRAWIDTTQRPAMLRVTFSEDVRFVSSPTFSTVVAVTAPGGSTMTSSLFNDANRRIYDPATDTLSFGLASSDLPTNGLYTITLSNYADDSGNAGATTTVQARFLRGDVDDDAAVGFSDLLALARHYGKSGQTYADGNFDMDPLGVVDFGDLLILARAYGTSVAPPTNAVAAIAKPSTGVRRRHSSETIA